MLNEIYLSVNIAHMNHLLMVQTCRRTLAKLTHDLTPEAPSHKMVKHIQTICHSKCLRVFEYLVRLALKHLKGSAY